jgi:hypothetical protein
MLDQLRKHAKSWITKSILAVMTAGLIFYFGYAGVRKSGGLRGKPGVIAVVNGESIPEGKFEEAYQNQLKLYEQLIKGNIPPALLETVKQNVLEKLIETKLFAEQARAIGLSVSDKELVQEIAMNQNFYRNGVFDKQIYLENFKPYYERKYGEDYEYSLREDLLAEKFEDLIRKSISVTEDEVKQEYLLSNTQLNLQKISFDETSWKEGPESRKLEVESQKSEGNQRPETRNQKPETLGGDKLQEISTLILAVLNEKSYPKGANPLEALKKTYNLKVEQTGFHSLRDKAAFVGDPEAHEVQACILKLTSENPVCPEGYTVGTERVFFKLIEKKDADLAKLEDEKKSTEKNLLSQRQALILRQIGDALIRQASIRTYLSKG